MINIKDRIGYLTLNRPEKRNALNAELVEALKLAVDALARSDYIQMDGDSFDVVDVARAAITKHGGNLCGM